MKLESPESTMRKLVAAVVLTAACLTSAFAADSPASPPKSGPVQIMKSSELKPGMMGTAWTVFVGTEAEPVPSFEIHLTHARRLESLGGGTPTRGQARRRT